MRVLVVGAHNNASCAVARSIGRRGHEVGAAGAEGAVNKAFLSRFVTRRHLVPDFLERASAAADEIVRIADAYDLLFPTSDPTALLLAERRAELPPLALSRAYENALDKTFALEAAPKAGLSVPPWTDASAREAGAVAAAAERWGYPVVVKPKRSVWRAGDGLERGKTVYARSREELLALLAEPDAPGLIVQKRVEGRGEGLSLFVHERRALLAFAHGRVREAYPLGSGSSAARSVSAERGTLERCLTLMNALALDGAAMVEFKRSDGVPQLMEINGRPWGSMPLALACGVDFPLFAAHGALGLPPPDAPAGYPVGVTWRWPRGELSHAYHVARGRPRWWPGSYPRRLSLLSMLRPESPRAIAYRLGDWLPDLAEAVRGLV